MHLWYKMVSERLRNENLLMSHHNLEPSHICTSAEFKDYWTFSKTTYKLQLHHVKPHLVVTVKPWNNQPKPAITDKWSNGLRRINN